MKKITINDYESIKGHGYGISDKSKDIDKLIEMFLLSDQLIVELEESDVTGFDFKTEEGLDAASKSIRWRLRANDKFNEEVKLSKRDNRLFLLRR